MSTKADEVDLEVSVGNLPEALSSLANNVCVWEAALAHELNKQHKAEQALNLIKVEMELKIRQDPLSYGFAKLTETLVETLVASQKQVIEAENALIEAKFAVNVTKAIVNALDTKRSACKYLTELVIRGFTNSTPTGSIE